MAPSGGRGPDGIMIAAHDVYDRQAGTWHNAAPLPLPRDLFAVVAADRRIRVIGGQHGSPVQRSGQHDVYDPAAGQWSAAAPLPTSRSGVAGLLHTLTAAIGIVS